GRDSIDPVVTDNGSQARRSHHRLLRRSRSDGKPGQTVAGQTQYFRRTSSAKNRLGASQPIPSGTAARAAAKVRMYGCKLSCKPSRAESLARLGASMYGSKANPSVGGQLRPYTGSECPPDS